MTSFGGDERVQQSGVVGHSHDSDDIIEDLDIYEALVNPHDAQGGQKKAGGGSPTMMPMGAGGAGGGAAGKTGVGTAGPGSPTLGKGTSAASAGGSGTGASGIGSGYGGAGLGTDGLGGVGGAGSGLGGLGGGLGAGGLGTGGLGSGVPTWRMPTGGTNAAGMDDPTAGVKIPGFDPPGTVPGSGSGIPTPTVPGGSSTVPSVPGAGNTPTVPTMPSPGSTPTGPGAGGVKPPTVPTGGGGAGVPSAGGAGAGGAGGAGGLAAAPVKASPEMLHKEAQHWDDTSRDFGATVVQPVNDLAPSTVDFGMMVDAYAPYSDLLNRMKTWSTQAGAEFSSISDALQAASGGYQETDATNTSASSTISTHATNVPV